MNYSAAFRAIRHRAGLPQQVLARAAGCSQAALSGIENGRNLPSIELVGDVAAALGVSPLLLHLEAVGEYDLPRVPARVLLMDDVDCLIEDLWKWRRTGGRQRVG
jgi:transcriptional regulator with XRE-family HTH domain